MPSAKKKRLDLTVLEKGLVKSRQRARALIMTGKVLVNNHPVDKPGAMVSDRDNILLKGDDNPYVSRFTDCLLQRGADRVYAVDVGYGQLAWKLRQDSRVVVMERTNIRHMRRESIPRPMDLVTIDVSFISLKIVVPAVLKFAKKDSRILALIKPQFEVGKGKVGKGGVVRDPLLHETVIRDLSEYFNKTGLLCDRIITSPLMGPKGNREFFISLIHPG
ncbi:MAG: TlyA family RNA methyltransferase [Deltaproteobacteria bacterium]|nr:TlyA family RNA methyltransferase [Deltaproteobacteria bacterium]